MAWEPFKTFSPFTPLEPAETAQEMRRSIELAQRDNLLVRNVLMAGRIAGMSGEDVYTHMAYMALQAMMKAQRELFDHLVDAPKVRTVFPTDWKPPT